MPVLVLQRGKNVQVDPALDADRLVAALWDRVTGTPAPNTHQDETCSATYPKGEGLSGVGLVALTVGGRPTSHPADSTWRSGAWHRIRIQVFPDGECRFAIDGVPVWRSPTRIPVNQRYRLLILGSSVDTKMLVGPLQIWRGVRNDLNWLAADQTATRRTSP